MYGTDWMQRRELLTPNRVALVDVGAGRRYTYRQINHRANRLAHALQDRFQVRRGDRMAILSMNCAEFLEVLFAAAKIGATLVPLNNRLVVRSATFLPFSHRKDLLHNLLSRQRFF